MKKPNKIVIAIVAAILLIWWYEYAWKDALTNYRWNNELVLELKNFKMPTVQEFKSWYKRNNKALSIPYLNIRRLDLLTWIWIIWLVLFLIIRKLNT
ncbi:MAG: hypothetical protein ACD_2C00015G0008 [uncultured bacterium (gcode 4)]|uniref:Uncharacterized protein n=1 Tax=uncultured bacterium (gcode 4) TaxID=1234023 RepID=K2GIK3_9BACT|nr:MAG: hypothetical protein ACD_2C00015G0008 [uncultured bacterium (gcode 4)]